MPSYYDNKTKNWYCIFYYTDWTGTRKQKKKRGFERKKDAQEWERDFLQRQAAQPDMPFSTLSELYLKDKEQNTKFATYRVHKMRVDTWLLPVFGNRPIVLGVVVQILMAGAAVGVIHEAPRLRLDFPPVERHAAARRGVYPQVFGPQPRFGRQHTDDVGARNVALHAFDGVAPRILRVGGKRQLLLMHPHFVTGQTERRR